MMRKSMPRKPKYPVLPKHPENREERLRLCDDLEKHRIPKHKRWDEIHWVVGYVDAYDAVHGKIVFAGDPENTHKELFPNVNRHKLWRWSKSEGLMGKCPLSLVEPSGDDWEAIRNWLYKNGILHDWEL